jgi:hypothetical protein
MMKGADDEAAQADRDNAKTVCPYHRIGRGDRTLAIQPKNH